MPAHARLIAHALAAEEPALRRDRRWRRRPGEGRGPAGLRPSPGRRRHRRSAGSLARKGVCDRAGRCAGCWREEFLRRPLALRRSRRCVVIGGGDVGLEKVEGLLACDGDVTLIAPEAHPDSPSSRSRGRSASRLRRRPAGPQLLQADVATADPCQHHPRHDLLRPGRSPAASAAGARRNDAARSRRPPRRPRRRPGRPST